MNLHLARYTGEQETGPVLPDVRVAGRRLRVASTNAEAHLRNQRTSATAVMRKRGEMHAGGGAVF